MYSVTWETGSRAINIVSPPKPAAVPNRGYFSALRNGKPLPIGSWEREFIDHSAVSGGVTSSLLEKRTGRTDTKTITGDCITYRTNRTSSMDYRPYGVSSDIQSRLTNEAVSKAKNGYWDVGTFAAELNKTHDLLSNVKTRSLRRVGNILDRKVGKVRTLAEFADAWLEYRYGWRILMYDIESAQQSYQSLREKHLLHRFTAHDSYVGTWSHQLERYNSYGTDGFVTLGSLHNNPGGTQENVKKTLDVRVGAAATASEFLGSHSYTINPAMTAWELVPFSFIVDWFVDVGSAVGAATPTFGRKLAYVWMSTRSEVTIDSRWWINPKLETAAYVYTGTASGYGQTKRTLYKRFPVSFTPFNLSFNPRLNLAKFTDLAAIFYNQQSHRLRRLRHG